MNCYRINYIDGFDLRYKSFETIAENEDTALSALLAKYTWGDFDHQIVEIKRIKGKASEGMRIGDITAPSPAQS